MRKLGFEQVRDSGEESLWIKRNGDDVLDTILVVIYSGKFQISGRREFAVKAHQVLKDYFGFSAENNYSLTDTLGIERETFVMSDERKGLFAHQTSYSKHAVQDYESLHYRKKELPGIFTPLYPKEEIEEEKVPMKNVPKLAAQDGSRIGGCMTWTGRGTRPDLLLPAKRMIQLLGDWTAAEQALTHRSTRCWKATQDYGLVMYGDPRDTPFWIVMLEADSDLANDVFSAKSTSSIWAWIMGPRTHVPVSASVKGTPATGRRTADVTVVAIDRGTFLHGLPLVTTLETILDRPVRLVMRSDNDAAISAARAG